MIEAEYIGKTGHYWIKRETIEEVKKVIKSYHSQTTIEEWTINDTIENKTIHEGGAGGEPSLLS